MTVEHEGKSEIQSQDSSKTSQALEKKKEKDHTPTKLLIRRLPPSLTPENFLEQVSPLPEHDFFYFVRADLSLGANAFTRAYINFLMPEDVFVFRDKFDGYVFLDAKGGEYPAIVEFAPFQKVPKKKVKKADPKNGTIEQDSDYKKFLDVLSNPPEASPVSLDAMVVEVEIKESQCKSSNGKVTTPLLDYVKKRREERKYNIVRLKEERRRGARDRDDRKTSGKEDRRTEKEKAKDREKERRRNKERMRDRKRELGKPDKYKDERDVEKRGKEDKPRQTMVLLKNTDREASKADKSIESGGRGDASERIQEKDTKDRDFGKGKGDVPKGTKDWKNEEGRGGKRGNDRYLDDKKRDSYRPRSGKDRGKEDYRDRKGNEEYRDRGRGYEDNRERGNEKEDYRGKVADKYRDNRKGVDDYRDKGKDSDDYRDRDRGRGGDDYRDKGKSGDEFREKRRGGGDEYRDKEKGDDYRDRRRGDDYREKGKGDSFRDREKGGGGGGTGRSWKDKGGKGYQEEDDRRKQDRDRDRDRPKQRDERGGGDRPYGGKDKGDKGGGKERGGGFLGVGAREKYMDDRGKGGRQREERRGGGDSWKKKENDYDKRSDRDQYGDKGRSASGRQKGPRDDGRKERETDAKNGGSSTPSRDEKDRQRDEDKPLRVKSSESSAEGKGSQVKGQSEQEGRPVRDEMVDSKGDSGTDTDDRKRKRKERPERQIYIPRKALEKQRQGSPQTTQSSSKDKPSGES